MAWVIVYATTCSSKTLYVIFKPCNMEHINEIELKDTFSENDFENYLNQAKLDVISKNGKNGIELDLAESNVNTNVNGHLGRFLKYRVIRQGNLIGYLEAFRNNKSNYLIIYTNPI